MQVLFGGVRGTSAVADPAYIAFGGYTTAILVRGADGECLMLDAGSGVRVLDAALQAAPRPELLLMLTHYHQDHLSGFSSFSRIYNPNWSLTIMGPTVNKLPIQKIFAGMMAPPFWPLQIESLAAKVAFTNLPRIMAEPVRWGGLEISWCPLHHPGGSLAYRVAEPATGKAFVLATDVEWQESTPAEQELLVTLCREPRPVDALIFDGHFSSAAYPRFKGWGHSTWQDAVGVADRVAARQLIVTHHDPASDDATLQQAETEMQHIRPTATFARQGMQLDLA